MNGGTIQDELGEFASRLFDECGGLVDWEEPGQTGTVVVPEDVARLLGCAETFAVSCQPDVDGIHISLASEFLDTAETLLQAAVPRVGTFELPERYLKGGDLQAAIDRVFTWHNARVRVSGSTPERVEYHTWWFFASLRSEDVWESRLSVTINAASHVALDLGDLLRLIDIRRKVRAETATPATFEPAVRQVREQMLREAADFMGRMEGRLERDRKRLRGYYGALQREAGRTKRRAAAPPAPEEIAARQRVVNLELRRKQTELQERYAMEAVIEPLVLVCVEVPVLAVELSVLRKQAQRLHTVYWNPIDKQFEPLRCSQCGAGSYSLAFTNDDVAPICSDCTKPGSAEPVASRTRLSGRPMKQAAK